MHFPFFTRGAPAGHPASTKQLAPCPTRAHAVESDFNYGICRFTLDCSCGVHYDTPFIDEALEWRELHVQLAPLADQLPA